MNQLLTQEAAELSHALKELFYRIDKHLDFFDNKEVAFILSVKEELGCFLSKSNVAEAKKAWTIMRPVLLDYINKEVPFKDRQYQLNNFKAVDTLFCKNL